MFVETERESGQLALNYYYYYYIIKSSNSTDTFDEILFLQKFKIPVYKLLENTEAQQKCQSHQRKKK